MSAPRGPAPIRLSLRGALADAVTLWRTDRDLMLRVAGVFLLVPMLAIGLLATTIDIPANATPEQVQDLVSGFYRANLALLIVLSLALEFGTLVLLHLYLQRGRSVGEALRDSGLRMLPWVLLALANGAVFQLGFALFVLPGLYVYGRTWLMGPAYVAEPERGLLGAVGRGFGLSSGNGWRLALLAFAVAVVLVCAILALVIVSGMLAALAGGSALVQGVLLVPVAAAGGAGYAFFTLVRIAAYRRLGGSINGM